MEQSIVLKNAGDEIQAILKKYDIAGVAVLQTPGSIYSVDNLETSYSCAFREERGLMLKADLMEDFDGDRDEMIMKVSKTAEMFNNITMKIGNEILYEYALATKYINGLFGTKNGPTTPGQN